MRSPYGFDIIESCETCKLREERMFCNLSREGVKAMQAIKATAAYPKGALLCLEGQPARGIYVLCNGHAKVYTSSAEGKAVILRIAGPGEVLGLNAVLSGRTYETTIETLEPTQANFISKADFMKFLTTHSEVGMNVARQLTHNCHCAYEEIRSLGLARTVPEKLARLILQWSAECKMHSPNSKVHFTVTLTQEEIAQMIGTSRETVSRTLADFKKTGMLQIKGATWIILNQAALEAQAQLLQ